jgi:hypothetical protein
MIPSETPGPDEGQVRVPPSEGDRVLRRTRPRLTYANVMSTIAVFIALGGSSYAAVTLNGRDIKHRSVSGAKIKRNALTRLEIRESSLTTVPRAQAADGLTDRAADALLRCPDGAVPAAGTCIEVEPRGDANYGAALFACGSGTTTHLQRRLPTHGELVVALTQEGVVKFGGPELTADVYPSATAPGGLDVLFLTGPGGSAGVTTNDSNGVRKFRCAVDPRPKGGQ